MANRKKRIGDRPEGRRIRSLDAYYGFIPYIMKEKNDACNFFKDSVEITEAERYLRQKKAEGYKDISFLHLFVAAYVRVVSHHPGINRYIAGQRIYARNNIEMVMTVKKEMSSSAGETSIKPVFEPTDTLIDVYNKINKEVVKVKTGSEETSTDNVANALIKLPGFLLRFVIWSLKKIDYYFGLPKFIRNASPFHGSMIITDLGSLGIPPIHHHLYNFGDLPVFIAFGSKYRDNDIDKNGNVVEHKYIDYTAVLDERICDGYYFAQAFKYLKSYLRHPEKLEVPPEKVVEDID